MLQMKFVKKKKFSNLCDDGKGEALWTSWTLFSHKKCKD